MARHFSLMIAAGTLAVCAAPASAQDANRFGHDAIEAGQYDEAESRLRAELALDPAMPEALLNLAAIYARTSRAQQAQTLYARVLEAENVSMLLTPTTALDSHAIAERGMRRLDAGQMVAR